MKRRVIVVAAVGAAVLGIGSTVARSATRGWNSNHMRGNNMPLTQAEMQSMMQQIHPGLDASTRTELAKQCVQAMNDGVAGMHGSAGHMGGGMMGGGGTMGGGGMMG